MHRRDLLTTAATACAASTLVLERVQGDVTDAPLSIIDTNASLFHWPFRRLPLDEPKRLSEKCRMLGIQESWVGSYEAILHRDLGSVNERLVQACRDNPRWKPVGSVNVQIPGWESDLRHCVQGHGMFAIRVYPGCHGYALDDTRLKRLVRDVSSHGLLLQIVVAMEDARTQHPMMRVPDVDLDPLGDLIATKDAAKIQLLGLRPTASIMAMLSKTPGIFIDLSRVEGTDGVSKVVSGLPQGRVMLGTNAPFLIPEAALIRVAESGLSRSDAAAVLAKNAAKMNSDHR